MEKKQMLILIVTLSSCFVLFVTILFLVCICMCKRRDKDSKTNNNNNNTSKSWDKEANHESGVEEIDMKGDFVKFQGGEDLTCFDILDAPGEVIGKSSFGTLYRANLLNDSVLLLRFLRPACTIGKLQDVMHVVQLLGSIRHNNLVPLCGFYSGPRGEKLLVHPFYRRGNLAQFIRDENVDSHRWEVIYRISTGVVRGLDFLHTGLQRPIIHGNLKSKNILLGRNHQPFVSDFGLHLLLNSTAAQEMLEDAAAEGYKAPELTKLKESNTESDIYNLGVILLELITGKEPINGKANPDQDFYLPTSIRNAIVDKRMSELYHPDVLEVGIGGSSSVNEDIVIKFVQLALACCSPSPSLRPGIKQICKRLEEIGPKS